MSISKIGLHFFSATSNKTIMNTKVEYLTQLFQYNDIMTQKYFIAHCRDKRPSTILSNVRC